MKKFIIALAMTVLSAPAWATFLSLEPAITDASDGDTVSLDLIIGDLGDGFSPSLGGFDIDIGFDDSALDFTSVTFGSMLGVVGPEALTDMSSSLGLVSLLEVSLLSIGDLDVLQGDSFVLATFEFLVQDLPLGSSTTVGFLDVLLSDAFGNELVADSLLSAVIRNPDIQVPEPPVIALFAIGLLLIGFARKRAA